jgi:hypothetical protein
LTALLELINRNCDVQDGIAGCSTATMFATGRKDRALSQMIAGLPSLFILLSPMVMAKAIAVTL